MDHKDPRRGESHPTSAEVAAVIYHCVIAAALAGVGALIWWLL